MSTTSASTVLAPEARLTAQAARDAAREDLCRFLAACYYEPEPAFAEERLFDLMRLAAERIDPALADHAARLGQEFAAEGPEALLVDYTRLFLGPVQALARPYSSVWLTGQAELMQDTTMDLLRMYEQAGFAIDEDFQELPDHVAVELEFLYLLIHRENQAARKLDAEALGAAQALRQSFLEAHLGRWLGPFILAMHDGAQSEFYKELAELTEMFVRLEGQLEIAG